MPEITPWVQDLQEEAGNRNVLLVEGRSDVPVVERWLEMRDADFRNRLLVRSAGAQPPAPEAGGYSKVVTGLRTHARLKEERPADYTTTWWGLVDRDERDNATIAEDEAANPTLRSLPRNCLESYFVIPEEIWTYLPEGQREQFPGGIDELTNAIEDRIDHWVVPWCMTKVLASRQHILTSELGFPVGLIRSLEEDPALDDDVISARIAMWQNHLSPEDILLQFQEAKTDALPRGQDEKLRLHVHGKKFFKRVIVADIFRERFGSKTSEQWLRDLVAGADAVPGDIALILDGFLA